jgi:hypothetical protein
MLKLKHLKTLQHVSISIQIIFRELVVSSLKSLNLKLKHLKTLQHVSISIQIIFRELVVSSLKSLNLKFLKICLKYKRSIVLMWQQSDFNEETTSSLKMI